MAYGGINGDLLQEGLCHTQVSCTQSSCPCGSPLLTHTSSGDRQTKFCLSLCAVSGSRCAQDMFQASEHLWRAWGLILKVILPSYHLLRIFLCPWTWGMTSKLLQHHASASPVPTILLGLLCPWTWGISSQFQGTVKGRRSEAPCPVECASL